MPDRQVLLEGRKMKKRDKLRDGVDLLRFFFESLCFDCRIPRKDRIDAPGALQHKICRSVERAKIFTPILRIKTTLLCGWVG